MTSAQTLPLFDYAEAQRRRDAAVTAVGEHADDTYMRVALAVVAELARSGVPFTTDDVVARMPEHVTTPEPRALGAVMTIARKRGIVEPMSEYRNSTLVSCHGRPKRLWRGVPQRGM